MQRAEKQNNWKQRVEDFRGSGMTRKEFCELENIKEGTLSSWITKYNRHFKDEKIQDEASSQGWVQLTNDLSRKKSENHSASLEVYYEGFRIDIKEGFTAEFFSEIVKGLKSIC